MIASYGTEKIIALLGIIWIPININVIFPWYKNLIIGILLLPVGFIVGYYMTFFILQHIRSILAPIVAGLLGAGLPFALDYLLTGRIELDEAKNAIFAATIGLSALLSTALSTSIISQLRKGGEDIE